MPCSHYGSGRIQVSNGPDCQGAYRISRTAQAILEVWVRDRPSSTWQANVVARSDDKKHFVLVAQRVQLLCEVAEVLIPDLAGAKGQVPNLHMGRLAHGIGEANDQICDIASCRLKAAGVVNSAPRWGKQDVTIIQQFGASHEGGNCRSMHMIGFGR
jgi:hypothetical protein